MYTLKIEKTGNFRTSKQINSVILSAKNHQRESNDHSFQKCAQKLKQIKALRRFEEIFQKQKQKKMKSDYEIQNKEQFYNYSHRLKGMFFLKKKVELQEKYKHIHESDESANQHIFQTKKLPESAHESSLENTTTLNFTCHPPVTSYLQKKNHSNKCIKNPIPISKRPSTRLHSTPQSKIKIFNSQNVVQLVLRANKIKVASPSKGVFSYFNVYVKDGNNSQMIKSIIRKRIGWRVVESLNVAQMVWSQFFNLAVDTRQHRNYKQIQSISDTGSPKALQLNKKTELSPKKPQNRLPTKNFSQKRTEQNIFSVELYQKEQIKLCPYFQQIHHQKKYQICPQSLFFYNHFPNHRCISDKKNLFINLSKYYQKIDKNVFEVIPYTMQINKIQEVQQLKKEERNTGWIIKPGENSNRGRGIVVCKNYEDLVQELKERLGVGEKNKKQKSQNKNSQTNPYEPENKNDKKIIGCSSTSKTFRRLQKEQPSFIVQKYIEPLLYNRRKFDIRMFLLVTGIKGKMRAYLYSQGYARTCSKIFTMNNSNKFIHLTNDAIQCCSSDYGKFEEGNKISWKKLQVWIQSQTPKHYWEKFNKDIKEITHDIVASANKKLLKKESKLSININRQRGGEKLLRQKVYYELFGLDFLIDKQLKLWLIEVNTNPALNTDCSRTLNSLLPKVIQNSLDIAVQPLIRANTYHDIGKYQNQYVCIFDDEWEKD